MDDLVVLVRLIALNPRVVVQEGVREDGLELIATQVVVDGDEGSWPRDEPVVRTAGQFSYVARGVLARGAVAALPVFGNADDFEGAARQSPIRQGALHADLLRPYIVAKGVSVVVHDQGDGAVPRGVVVDVAVLGGLEGEENGPGSGRGAFEGHVG